ncbi:hypothetical protein [Nitratifractor sp.]|uniref:hypothetical protein n=1 Tax=Nitratifractor sp. TaxID=2268144 RepID=UPI0025E19225|nr:hypothetical protein [Nitratifractor sp.]
MEDSGKKLFDRFLFYAVVLTLLTVLAAFFFPAASVLRTVAQRRGEGMGVLIPVAFLLLGFLYSFVRARRYLLASRLVPAYGWLLGATLLSVMLLYLYLRQMTGG